MITQEQITQCKERLLKRQTDLIHQVQDHFGMAYEFSQESIGELSNYDNHPADHGTALFERGKDLALNEHAEKELEEINEALHAIEEGTYGICSKCGADISLERLEAVPATDRCIEHADQVGFERSRPVEEQVFSPNINPDEVTERSEERRVGKESSTEEGRWQ